MTRARVAAWPFVGATIMWFLIAFAYLFVYRTNPMAAYRTWSVGSSALPVVFGAAGIVLFALYGTAWKKYLILPTAMCAIFGAMAGCLLIPFDSMGYQSQTQLLLDDPLDTFGSLAIVLACAAFGSALAIVFWLHDGRSCERGVAGSVQIANPTHPDFPETE